MSQANNDNDNNSANNNRNNNKTFVFIFGDSIVKNINGFLITKATII